MIDILKLDMNLNKNFLALDLIPTGILLIDPKTHMIVYTNLALSKIIGAPKEKLIGLECHKNICLDEKESCPVTDLKRKVINSESFLLDSNGKPIPIIKTVLIINLNGNQYLLESITDISQYNNRVEVKLKNLEKRLKILFEYAPDAYYLSDTMGNFIDGNRAAENLVGYEREELIGKNFLKLNILLPSQIKVAAKLLAKNILRKPTGPDEFILIRKDGRQVEVEISTYPVKIENKNIVLGIARDITERKKLEDKLKQAANHDSLTGLYSRSFFEEEMKLLSKEREISIGLIVLDIDGLKYINDILGHQEGDKLLINLSKILLATFRPSDVIARIGGDEFAVLIRDVDNNKLNETAQRLNNNILAYNQKLKSYQNPIHVSAGYAIKDVPTKKIEQVLKEADDMLFKEKIPKREDVRKSILNVIKTTMLEKDLTTKERIGRLTSLASSFSDAMNLSDEEKRKLILTTELHDIGKIVIPDDVLNKRGKLSFEDFEHIKKHPEAGYRIAMAIPEISHVAEYILYSHERWDGKGYPKELIGEEIPLISRMTLIIDAYDAITNNRPYRKASSIKQAINELKYNAGTQFDPELIDIFVNKVIFNI
jgi:diguanylate cyclase (GGDEF)-like protein/PAS domain S-box-containing protein